MCQDDHRHDHLVRATGAVPPIANSSENTSAATGTLTNAPTAAAGATTPTRLGSTARTPRKTSQPTPTPTSAIRVMLVPRAVIPPSAMKSACTSSTVLRHSTAVHGPTSTAASAPPRRCPLVPAPTGKFIIWPAKTKVATRPAIGRGTVVEFPAGAAQRQRHPADRDHTGRDRGRGVEEAVGNVHADHTTLLQVVRNKPRSRQERPP